MGRSRRNKPVKLSHKLLAIRKRLRMSQTEMARALELKVHYSAVSNYELGTREPDLIVVLRYARLAGVPMEMIVDDKLNLPESITKADRINKDLFDSHACTTGQAIVPPLSSTRTTAGLLSTHTPFADLTEPNQPSVVADIIHMSSRISLLRRTE